MPIYEEKAFISYESVLYLFMLFINQVFVLHNVLLSAYVFIQWITPLFYV